MGHFAINVGLSHQIGTARGRLSVLSAMDISGDEFFAAFGKSINDLLVQHREDLDRNRKMLSKPDEPKMRWVDGTPEYSSYIYGLRKLFPEALFVHIVRDVRDVVRSMLNFHRLAGYNLVANEQAAYRLWLKAVSDCVQAEQAFGPQIVHRFQYSALIDNPEPAIRTLLEFLGESFFPRCLDPLAKRINSSDVPPDFKAEDAATDAKLVEKSTLLSRQLLTTSQSQESSSEAADVLQAAFEERVKHLATTFRR